MGFLLMEIMHHLEVANDFILHMLITAHINTNLHQYGVTLWLPKIPTKPPYEMLAI